MRVLPKDNCPCQLLKIEVPHASHILSATEKKRYTCRRKHQYNTRLPSYQHNTRLPSYPYASPILVETSTYAHGPTKKTKNKKQKTSTYAQGPVGHLCGRLLRALRHARPSDWSRSSGGAYSKGARRR